MLPLISENFIKAPRHLNYDWFKENLSEISNSIDEYLNILRTHKKFNRKESEKSIFHQFFKNNTWVLTRDLFQGTLYEPSLMKNAKNYEEPDFILTSNLPVHIPTNITEIKLPTLKILEHQRRKPIFLKPFIRAMSQVQDYKRYIKKNKDEVKKVLNYETVLFSYTLLGSNEEEIGKNEQRIKELLKDQYRGINHLTFEKHSDLSIKYYERLNDLKISS